jgi:hypothetical protein
VPPNEWRPAHEMLDMIAACRLLTGRRSGEILGARGLDDRHFESGEGSDDRAATPTYGAESRRRLCARSGERFSGGRSGPSERRCSGGSGPSTLPTLASSTLER